MIISVIRLTIYRKMLGLVELKYDHNTNTKLNKKRHSSEYKKESQLEIKKVHLYQTRK